MLLLVRAEPDRGHRELHRADRQRDRLRQRQLAPFELELPVVPDDQLLDVDLVGHELADGRALLGEIELARDGEKEAAARASDRDRLDDDVEDVRNAQRANALLLGRDDVEVAVRVDVGGDVDERVVALGVLEVRHLEESADIRSGDAVLLKRQVEAGEAELESAAKRRLHHGGRGIGWDRWHASRWCPRCRRYRPGDSRRRSAPSIRRRPD